MAISDSKTQDKLSKLLGDSRYDRRRDVWLWLHLRNEGANFPLETCNGSTMRDQIASFLAVNSDLLEQIPAERDRQLLEDADLKWIEETDERQHRWLRTAVSEITELRPPKRLARLSGRALLIAMIDIWEVDLNSKARAIRDLKEEWRQHKAGDKALEWFNAPREGPLRCNCANDWLERHYPDLLPRLRPFNSYQDLLIFFDQAAMRKHELKAMLLEIKKRWNKQQFDSRNAAKKQVNVLLEKTAIAQLDELAKQHGLKRAEIIERLVKAESERNVYLIAPREGSTQQEPFT